MPEASQASLSPRKSTFLSKTCYRICPPAAWRMVPLARSPIARRRGRFCQGRPLFFLETAACAWSGRPLSSAPGMPAKVKVAAGCQGVTELWPALPPLESSLEAASKRLQRQVPRRQEDFRPRPVAGLAGGVGGPRSSLHIIFILERKLPLGSALADTVTQV